jgi:glucose-1-phosphate thymidylyltransferase
MKNKLKVELMGRGSAWLDTGNPESLFDTSQFIQSIEKRQGLKIACLEEIALSNKWISQKEILKRIKFYGKCSYSDYLKKLL